MKCTSENWHKFWLGFRGAEAHSTEKKYKQNQTFFFSFDKSKLGVLEVGYKYSKEKDRYYIQTQGQVCKKRKKKCTLARPKSDNLGLKTSSSRMLEALKSL